ncbi:MAG: ABC transporter ATP-binding protein, partial [Clostridia bacterium]|nr:ABC transporter ATP-binding protein [Clostridia bacterium]
MLRQIAEWLKPYRKESLLGPFFKLLEASMELSVPFVVAAIIDRGIAEGDSGRIVRFCLLLALFGFAGLLFSVTAQYFAAKAAVGVAANLRMSLFEKIQSFSY